MRRISPADLNPQSLEVLPDAKLESALAKSNSGEPVQFERQGYFCPDPDSTPAKLVFNRTVGLRDTYAKVAAGGLSRRCGHDNGAPPPPARVA